MTEAGLRARKKLQTRQHILEVATGLFAERGFDVVTVAEIARIANVSEKTVFNYFGTKDDLIFGGMDDFGAALLLAIQERPRGMSPYEAFGNFVVQPRGMLDSEDPQAMEHLAAIARVIDASAVLQARQRQLFEASADRLAGVLAGEADTDIAAGVVANAMVGVLRAMQKYLHRAVLDGYRGPCLVDDVLTQGRQAVDMLGRGLAGYLEGQ
ncbi:TetR family transcriptional regulator [Nocardia sp. SYP-A9097]|uniref:TetR/AcrR family transcriptional regulator n=1 Tax=Nocardia sp. SYP-A9097 TaxID=2663237 RepID=UPI00129B416B|nr:TetR/AcrR family transcriptional regulator [Nocardia sp. SYP-A9097]MRH90269.1 TetR family transcriptional regulator [Nocardia sp. SYP-A9097]